MEIEKSLNRIRQLFAQIESEVAISNKADLLDVNIIAEDVMRPILAVVFDLLDLLNLNRTDKNSAGVDLGDREAGVAIQITSRTDNEKIKDMLGKVVKNRRYVEFTRILLFVLKEDTPNYREAGWKDIIDGKFVFDRSNIVTFGDLFQQIRNFEPAKIRNIERILEETVGSGSFFSFAALREACMYVSKATIKTKLGKRITIERDTLRGNIDAFIASNARHAFVTGRSAVGKSTALATEAVRLREKGYTVLFIPVQSGTLFTLEDVAHQVRNRLPVSPPGLEWARVVRPWEAVEEASEPAEQLIIVIDGLEASERVHIATQLAQLDRSLALHSASAVKILLSCRDDQLGGILREEVLQVVPSFKHRPADHDHVSRFDFERFNIDDFSSRELDRALQEIGASELLRENDSQGQRDSHVSSMRALLTHPGTFEHYADLFARGEIDKARSETWSSLLRRRIDFCVSEAERFCEANAGQIRQMLVRMARYCWETKIAEFAVSEEILRNIIPELFTPDTTGRYAFAALIRTGVLQGGSMTEFAITDAGPYLLSFELEKQFASAVPDERKKIVASWLNDRLSYWPLLDAVLALIDRLSEEPDSHRKNLLAIVETLVSHHHDDGLFRLLRPSILRTIFKLVKQGDEDGLLYDYKEPALQVRYSEENVGLIETNLKDASEHARELAAILAGQYRLEHLVPQLIEGIEDVNENVARACYKAISQIGKSALDPLIAALKARAGSHRRTNSVVWAIIGVGFLSDELSIAVDELFKSLPAEDTPDLNRLKQSLLLLSGTRRDKLQAAHAAMALQSPDEKISMAAAKYFAEAPSADVFDDLVTLLQKTEITAIGAWRGQWYVSQLITAILAVDHDRGEPVVTQFLNDLFVGDNTSHRLWVTDVAEKRGLAGCYPVIYENLVQRFNDVDAKVEYVWYRIAEQLMETWSSKALDDIHSTAEALRADGIDPAKVFVDALYPHIGEDTYRYGDRLNRITDLRIAIMGSSESFGREAMRLFDVTSRFGSMELAEFFWILADTTFESPLLAVLEKEVEKNRQLPRDEQRLTVTHIAKALGTCGTRQSAEKILSFICDQPTGIHIDFADEVLVPFLVRGLLTPDELSGAARDPASHIVGRALCIEALARHNASPHAEFFADLADEASDFILQRAAVKALGGTKSSQAIAPLRRMLRRTKVSEEIRGWSAYGLAVWINDRDSLADIEDAFLDLEKYDDVTVRLFIGAINHFGEPGSAKILPFVEHQKLSQQIKHRINEAEIEYPADPGADAARARMLEFATMQSPGFSDPQRQVVHMMLDKGGPDALNMIAEYLEKGRLTFGSRTEIIRHLRKLAAESEVDRETLLRLALPLVAERDPQIRYNLLSVFQFLDRDFCTEVYRRAISESGSEWTRACAVELLGYWESDPVELAARRWDSAHLVRQSADLAAKQIEKRRNLKHHVERLQDSTGTDRLMSYLCLKNNGDRGTIRQLHDLFEVFGGWTVEWVQVYQLMDEIRQQIDRRDRDLKKEQKKRLDERGSISFD